VRDVQGLRPDDGDRPRARRPRRAQDGRPGLREAVPDDLLQRVPGRPRAVLPPRGAPTGRTLRRAARGGEAPRLGGRARRPAELAEEVVRHRRVLPLARVAHLPDARARLPLPLPQLRPVPRLRRLAAAARGPALPDRRAHAARGGGDARRRRRARLPRVERAGAGPRLGAASPRDPRAASLPRRRRPGLPDPRPPVAHALRGRGPAGDPRHRSRRLAHEHALRARRALGRPAPPRRRTATPWSWSSTTRP
jgi:hypothetical protein